MYPEEADDDSAKRVWKSAPPKRAMFSWKRSLPPRTQSSPKRTATFPFSWVKVRNWVSAPAVAGSPR